jgi:hypothetical protein
MTIKSTAKLSKQEIGAILTEYLKQKGFTVENLDFVMKTHCSYGMDERDERDELIFDGVTFDTILEK